MILVFESRNPSIINSMFQVVQVSSTWFALNSSLLWMHKMMLKKKQLPIVQVQEVSMS